MEHSHCTRGTLSKTLKYDGEWEPPETSMRSGSTPGKQWWKCGYVGGTPYSIFFRLLWKIEIPRESRWKLHQIQINAGRRVRKKKCVPGYISVTQPCPTLWDPKDYSPPGSSVHGILQQEHWSGLPFLPPGASSPRDQTCIFCIGRQILYCCATWEAPCMTMESS